MKRKIGVWLLLIACLMPPAALANQTALRAEAPAHAFSYLAFDGYIYYAVQTSDQSFTMFRMREMDQSAEKLRVLDAQSLATDGDHLFFDAMPAGDEHLSGLARMRLDGTEMGILYPSFFDETVVVGEYVYGLTMDLWSEEGLVRIRKDLPLYDLTASEFVFGDEDVQMLRRGYPYCLTVHGGFLYYLISLTDDFETSLCRMDIQAEDPATTDEILCTMDNVSLNMLGFAGDALYIATAGERREEHGFLAKWTEREGLTYLPLLPSFAYDRGYFYFNEASAPYNEHAPDNTREDGIFRVREDGSGMERVAPAGVTPVEIAGDWLFAYEGGGLNARQVMISLEDGFEMRDVPGFSEYAYPTPAPTPIRERLTIGEGAAIFRRTTDAGETACVRIIDADTGEEVFKAFIPELTFGEVRFPVGRYILKLAEGSDWISDAEAFGSQGSYYATEPYDFAPGEYSIRSDGAGGDVRADSAEGFLR